MNWIRRSQGRGRGQEKTGASTLRKEVNHLKRVLAEKLWSGFFKRALQKVEARRHAEQQVWGGVCRFSKVFSLYLKLYYVVDREATPCPFLEELFSRGANNSKPSGSGERFRRGSLTAASASVASRTVTVPRKTPQDTALLLTDFMPWEKRLPKSSLRTRGRSDSGANRRISAFRKLVQETYRR